MSGSLAAAKPTPTRYTEGNDVGLKGETDIPVCHRVDEITEQTGMSVSLPSRRGHNDIAAGRIAAGFILINDEVVRRERTERGVDKVDVIEGGRIQAGSHEQGVELKRTQRMMKTKTQVRGASSQIERNRSLPVRRFEPLLRYAFP